MLTEHRMKPLGLYIHWPFCLKKCPYCDFNSHVRETIYEVHWEKALLHELEYEAQKTPHHRLVSIFFGGGTPSLMSPRTVEALISKARALWPHDTNIEITLEANPGTVDSERFQAFRDAGINRLSLGIQSLRPDALKALGRIHTTDQSLHAIQLSQEIFPRSSFDLIYARSSQTLKDWESELKEALTLAGAHLSLYQLTIEKGTAFYTQYKRGDLPIPADDEAADFYLLTEEILKTQHFHSYEISNYARDHDVSQHNMVYWTYGDYCGIGPGAHGRVGNGHQKQSFQRIKTPELWLDSVEKNGHGIARTETLSLDQQLWEYTLMGLRLVQGLEEKNFSTTTGKTFHEAFSSKRLITLEEEGFLIHDNTSLRATQKGRLCLNQILQYLS